MSKDSIIANNAYLKPINKIAEELGISSSNLFLYGDNKAKINPLYQKGNAKVVLLTAISPTPAGEGKTTTTIGLGDALNKLNHKTIICLREPSLGPVFGLKGGACGGGMHQVIPMIDINLHFTGDMHAITSANNLICAVLDNSIYFGNPLNIDPNTISIKRVLDINDRELRQITIGQGGKGNGIVREDHFEITVACELMAILCLSNDELDFKKRVENMQIAKTYDGKNVYVKDLAIIGSIMALMKDCLKPNLVQTLENNPVLIHGGPFANIAHGCNSIIATNTACNLADIVVTEAGFGSDLGYEKFLDIKCNAAGIKPDCVVLVATIRALKMHGGVKVEDLDQENIEAIKKGFANLKQHAKNLENTDANFVICVNEFENDTPLEKATLQTLLEEHNYDYAFSNGYQIGSDGVIALASKVLAKLALPNHIHQHYLLTDSLDDKLNKVIANCYGGDGFIIADQCLDKYQSIKNDMQIATFPICIAKTPKSFSDDETLINAPSNFKIKFTDFKVNYGAQFIICYANKIMTMPGLSKKPNACKITYENGIVNNLD